MYNITQTEQALWLVSQPHPHPQILGIASYTDFNGDISINQKARWFRIYSPYQLV